MNALNVRRSPQTGTEQQTVQLRREEDVVHRVCNKRSNRRRQGNDGAAVWKKVSVRIATILANERKLTTESVIILKAMNYGAGCLFESLFDVLVILPRVDLVRL